MSVYIKGLKMPENQHTITVTICNHGYAVVEFRDNDNYPSRIEAYKAIPVPPHGRMIDEEQPIKNIEDAIENMNSDFPLLDFNSRYCMERGLRMAKIFVKTATTIIPADKEEA